MTDVLNEYSCNFAPGVDWLLSFFLLCHTSERFIASMIVFCSIKVKTVISVFGLNFLINIKQIANASLEKHITYGFYTEH